MRFIKPHTKLFYLDLLVTSFTFSLMAMDAFARAGGGGSSKCHAWYCILIYPFVLAYSGYVGLRLTFKENKISKTLKTMAQTDAHWNEAVLLQMAKDNFITLQNAWSSQNLDTMRANMHPQLYASWETDINAQKARGEKNIMSGLSVIKVRVVDVQNYRDDTHDEFTVEIDAQANDQTFVNNVLTKTDMSKFREFWTYVWEKDHWLLREVTQSNGWKRFVKAPIINEQ